MQQKQSHSLGVVLTFGLHGYTTDTYTLGEQFDAAGLDTSVIRATRRERANVARALRELETDGLLRRILEDADRAVYVLVEEHVEGEDASYAVGARITYSKKTRSLTCTSPAVEARLHELLAAVREQQTAADIRQALVRALDRAGAVRLRPDGGAYFVLDSAASTCEAVATFARTVDGWATCLPVLRTDGSRREMLAAMERHMHEELETIEAEMQRVVERSGGPRGIRPDTWAALEKQTHEVIDRVRLFEIALEHQQERVTERANDTLARLAALTKELTK